jgi:hypothetical protein
LNGQLFFYLKGTFAALALMTGAIIQQVQEDLKDGNDNVIVVVNNSTIRYQFNNAEIAIVCSFLVGCYQLIFGENVFELNILFLRSL